MGQQVASILTVQQYLDEPPRPQAVRGRSTKTPNQRLIFFLASAGKLFEGLVIFMIGMALPLITEDFALSSAEAGLVTATSLVGILLGALFLGHLSDELGRRKMFIAEMVLFTIFLAGFTISPSLPVLIACLLGMGMALGYDYPTAHLMLSETMPTSSRSRTVLGAFAFQAVGAVVGAALAVAVLSMPTASVSSWRVLCGLVVLPAALVTAGRFFTPQSPHWLLTRGRVTEAEDALARILQVRGEKSAGVRLDALPASQRVSESYADLFRHDGSLRATILASAPWFLQDLSTYGIGIFTPVIIATALSDPFAEAADAQDSVSGVVRDSLVGAQGAVMIDLFLVVGILVAIHFVDRLGSIRMQIVGFVGCAAGLGIAAASAVVPSATMQTVLIFAGFITFQFMTNAGPNAQTYLIAGEVFPTSVRGTGAGFAAASGKAGAAITAFLFPTLLDGFGQTPILIGLMVCSLAGAAVTSRFRIYTTGKNLEVVHEVGQALPLTVEPDLYA